MCSDGGGYTGTSTTNRDPLPESNSIDPQTKTPINVETYNQHGTHIAGTISAEADNAIGIVGVNPTAKIMAIKI